MSADLLDAFGGGEEAGWSDVQKPAPKLKTTDEAEEDADDDFGDFEDPEDEDETVEVPKVKDDPPESKSTAAFEHARSDVASDSDFSQIQGNSDDQIEEWGEFVDRSVLFDVEQIEQPESKPPTPPPKPVPDESYDFDANDDWEPVNFAQSPLVPAEAATATLKTGASKDVLIEKSLPSNKKDVGPPPTNIPPPGTLLAFIASFFETLPNQLKKLLPSDPLISNVSSGISRGQADRIKELVSVTRASARVIAGRKLRWQRDNILSQSMSIGAAGHGGIKLQKIDKAESFREDQEVAEILSIWKRHLGIVRSLVAKANHKSIGLALKLPTISEDMKVSRTKEGGVSAPKSCFLCGILRDERVAKLDLTVEDSFGEWWREHWGHVDCVLFWEECKDKLPQR